jgi:carboxymethylenebutenolidase
MGHMISCRRPEGQDVNGYLAESAARYRALVPDLYCGKVALAAVFVPEVDAGVPYYGYPPLEYIDASKITATLLGHWATDTAGFTSAW